MRARSKAWRSANQRAGHRWIGVGLAAAGVLLVVKVLPLWIWPVGLGLWLLWAGLGPLVIGALLVLVGMRLIAVR